MDLEFQEVVQRQMNDGQVVRAHLLLILHD